MFGTSGVGMYVSGEFGRQWLGTSDAFYGVVSALGNFAAGIPYASYDTWNIGIGFTYKVFTLDLRYSDTDLSKGNCNAFTSAFNASGNDQRHPDQSGWRRLELVRRGRHRQALGRPDRDGQPE